MDAPKSRIEALIQNILGESHEVTPQSRVESILAAIADGATYSEDALSRIESLLKAIANGGEYTGAIQSRVERILYAILTGGEYTNAPKSRIEALLLEWLNNPEEYVTESEPYLYRRTGGTVYA